MRDDVANLLNMVTSPTTAARRLAERPSWLLPFLVVSVGTTALAWLNLPLIEKVLLARLPADPHTDQMATIYRIGQTIGVALTPAGILLNWAFSTLLIWGIARVFDEKPSFRRVFSLVGHCSVITFIGVVLSWVIIRARGIETVSVLNDLEVSLGVTLLMDGNQMSELVRSILSHASVFAAWYWVVLAVGLSRILPSTRRTAAIIAGSAFAASVVFSAGTMIVAEAVSASGLALR